MVIICKFILLTEFTSASSSCHNSDLYYGCDGFHAHCVLGPGWVIDEHSSSMQTINKNSSISLWEYPQILYSYLMLSASLAAQMVKNPPALQETWAWSLGWVDPLEEGLATHSSILAWRISMHRRAWWATVHGVTKSQTWLSDSAQLLTGTFREKFANSYLKKFH